MDEKEIKKDQATAEKTWKKIQSQDKIERINQSSQEIISQYKSQMDKIVLSLSLEQIQKKLSKHKIYFDINFSPNKQRQLQVIDYTNTINNQMVSLKVKLGPFQLQLQVLNIPTISQMHNQKFIASGSYGSTYQFIFNGQQGVCKCLSFQKVLQIKNSQDIKIQYFKNIIEEYCFLKICSILEIGPFIPLLFGFDLIFYKQCVEFAMQRCLPFNLSFKNSAITHLLSSLKLLHSMRIVHRDIKPQNTLFSRKFNKYVFSDFGTSLCIQETVNFKTQTYFVGTYRYVSQEMKTIWQNKGDLKGFVNLYYNDLYGIKISAQKIQSINFQYNLNKIDIENKELYEQIFIKYLILTENIETLQSYKQIIQKMKSKIPKILLQFSPTEPLRLFYINNIKYNFNEKTQVDDIYGKQSIKKYLPKINNKKIKIYEKHIKLLENLKIKTNIGLGFQRKMLKNRIFQTLKNEQENNLNFDDYCYNLVVFINDQSFKINQKKQISKKFIKKFKQREQFTNDVVAFESVQDILQSLLIVQSNIRIIISKQIKIRILKSLIQIYCTHFKLIKRAFQCIYILWQICSQNCSQNLIFFLSQFYLVLTIFCSRQLDSFRQKIAKIQSQLQKFPKIIELLTDIKCIIQHILSFDDEFDFTIQEPVILKYLDKFMLQQKDWIDQQEHMLKIIFLTKLNLFKEYFKTYRRHDAYQLYQQITASPKFKQIRKIAQYHLLYEVTSMNFAFSSYKKGESYLKQHQQYYGDKQFSKQYLKFADSSRKLVKINILNQEIKYEVKKEIQIMYRQKLQRAKKTGLRTIYLQNLNSIVAEQIKIQKVSNIFMFQLLNAIQIQLCDNQFIKSIQNTHKKSIFSAFYFVITYYKLQCDNQTRKIRFSVLKIQFPPDYYKMVEKCQFLLEVFQKYYPQQLMLYYIKGIVLRLQKKFEQALVSFQKCYNTKPLKYYCGLQCMRMASKIIFDRGTNHDQILGLNLRFQVYSIQKSRGFIHKSYDEQNFQYIFVAMRNGCKYKECFQLMKWHALVNFIYNSQKLFKVYQRIVQYYVKYFPNEFAQRMFELCSSSGFYHRQSKIKQLSVFFIYLQYRIFRILSKQVNQLTTYRIALTLSLISSRSQQFIKPYLYLIKSKLCQNKRQQMFLFKKYMKYTQKQNYNHKVFKKTGLSNHQNQYFIKKYKQKLIRYFNSQEKFK